MTHSTFVGGISESFRENWEAHTVRPGQAEPDAFDIFTWYAEIPNTDRQVPDPGTDGIRADWGAWACKVTKKELLEYNRRCREEYCVPDRVLTRVNDTEIYAMIDAEDIGTGLD